MKIGLTGVIVEDLTGLRQQRLNMLPYPRGPIAHHTKADGVFRNQPCLFDVGERFTQRGLILNLMLTEQMHDSALIDEIKANPFGIAPSPFPRRPFGPRASLS
jgi:hypothetical protein